MRRRPGVLAVLVGALLVVEGAAIAAIRNSRHTGRGPEPTAVPATALPAETVVPAGRSLVSGTVRSVHLVGAVGPPLATPVVISIPNRGQGELNIERVVFQGQTGATVAWDGGQPLPIGGTGAFDLGPATLDADAGGLTWHLDGMPRFLEPGHYTAGSSVAVGVAGLAQPLDGAAFDVAPGAQAVMVSVGDARIHLPPRAEHVSGPGEVQLLGALTVRTASGIRTVGNLHFGPGPFDLTLQPAAGGFRVTGVVEGPLTLLR